MVASSSPSPRDGAISADLVRQYRNARPFEPFTVVMRDGRTFAVGASHAVAISPNGSQICVASARLPEFVAVDQIRELRRE